MNNSQKEISKNILKILTLLDLKKQQDFDEFILMTDLLKDDDINVFIEKFKEFCDKHNKKK